MKTALRIAVLAAAIALSGCATQAQKEALSIRANVQSAGQALIACTKFVYESPEMLPLRANMPLSLVYATLQQETNSNYATDAETAAVFAVHPQLKVCRNTFLSQIGQTTPTLVPVFSEVLSENEETLIALVQKKLTWGDYIRQLKKNTADGRVKVAGEVRNIDTNLERSNQAELESRQRALEAIARFAQTQAIIESLNRPVVTTTRCTGFGNMVGCTGVSR